MWGKWAENPSTSTLNRNEKPTNNTNKKRLKKERMKNVLLNVCFLTKAGCCPYIKNVWITGTKLGKSLITIKSKYTSIYIHPYIYPITDTRYPVSILPRVFDIWAQTYYINKFSWIISRSKIEIEYSDAYTHIHAYWINIIIIIVRRSVHWHRAGYYQYQIINHHHTTTTTTTFNGWTVVSPSHHQKHLKTQLVCLDYNKFGITCAFYVIRALSSLIVF